MMSDALLAQSAIDRLTSGARSLVIEGPSYRQRYRLNQRAAVDDVGLVENAKQTLLPLPQHVEQALAKTIPETYVGCIQQSDFAHPPISPPTVSCTEPHNGRPIGGVRLGRPHDPYPPVAMVRSRAAHGCVARARQWSRTHGTSDGVAFRAPDKQFWDLDIYRSAACYILTSN